MIEGDVREVSENLGCLQSRKKVEFLAFFSEKF